MIRPITLIAEASEERRARLAQTLSDSGSDVREVPRPSALAATFRTLHPQLVVIGCSTADQDEALSAVLALRALDRRLPIILVAHAGSEALVIAALRSGVKDYFADPLDCGAVAGAAQRCLGAGRSSGGIPPRAVIPGHDPMIGASPAMRQVRAYLDRIAPNDATVLITGETGTGKELAALRLHEQSLRRQRRFVSINCAAIPEGLLESELFGYDAGAFTGATRTHEGLLQQADRGTVLFDEIGEMNISAQAKILRAIETREVYRLGGRRPVPVDVRIIAATNQNLERAMGEGRFRKDLFFRLNVAHVHLPPLRDRRDDVPGIIAHYLAELNGRSHTRVKGFTDRALGALQAYDWPGNVRELKNFVEAVFVCPPSETIGLEDLPDRFQRAAASLCSIPDDERQRLLDALFAAKWNRSRAAQLLRWSRMTLYRKMAKYEVLKSPEADPLRSSLRPKTRRRDPA